MCRSAVSNAPRRLAVLALAAGLGVAFSSASAAAKPKLPSRIVVCGEVLTESLRVANNLRDCPDDGLVVGAPGITIDLGGHRIDGIVAATNAGIDNGAGHDGVVVRNGIVSEFGTGVLLQNASGNTLTQLRVQGTTGSAISLIASSRNSLAENTLEENDNLGIVLQAASNENTLAANHASGNGSSGIFILESSANTLTANVASANAAYGIDLFAGSGNTLKGNTTEGNQFDGIRVDGPGSDCLLKGNRASANVLNGIEVTDGAGHLLVANSAHENGLNGIASNTNAVTLKKNKTNGNGFLGGGTGDDVGLGLLVPAGATSSGNKASGNDNPHECEATDLSCYVP